MSDVGVKNIVYALRALEKTQPLAIYLRSGKIIKCLVRDLHRDETYLQISGFGFISYAGIDAVQKLSDYGVTKT